MKLIPASVLAFMGDHVEHLDDILSATDIVLARAIETLEDIEDGAPLAGALRATMQTLYGWCEEAQKRVNADWSSDKPPEVAEVPA